MMYLLKLFGVLLLSSIIGPYSQAILSNTAHTDMNYHGYQCHTGLQRQKIVIHYQKNSLYQTSCHVNTQKNSGTEQVLWSAKRNHDICYNNATALATRLIDGGWQCQSATLRLKAELKKEVPQRLQYQ